MDSKTQTVWGREIDANSAPTGAPYAVHIFVGWDSKARAERVAARLNRIVGDRVFFSGP